MSSGVNHIVRLLCVEDDLLDFELLVAHFAALDFPAELERVETREDFERKLVENHYDCILSDYHLPQLDAIEAISSARKLRPETPLIILSGTVADDVAVECLKLGASDYLLKDNLVRLIPAIRRAQREAAAFRRRQALEQQLVQSQKLEALGRLAGGIAHDFNNQLTIILGFCDLALASARDNRELTDHLKLIKRAGERSAELTSQLLTFSRKQILKPQVVYLSAVLSECQKMMRRLIGEDITLKVASEPRTARIHVDPLQLEQAILNLAVNARDAMPNGGCIGIAVREEEVKAKGALAPDRYGVLEFSDDGAGIPEVVRRRIFDPFFTTKDKGKGTGLGLAMVHGFVSQSGGHIDVKTAVGEGTSFYMYFPLVAEEAQEYPTRELTTLRTTGHETILLVEDEGPVRTLLKLSLEKRGYTVLDAAFGEEALMTCRTFKPRISLLITDMVMPGLNGRELAEAARLLRPDLKILFMSGYTDDAIFRDNLSKLEHPFLQKPVSPHKLALTVRGILDGFSAHPA